MVGSRREERLDILCEAFRTAFISEISEMAALNINTDLLEGIPSFTETNSQ